jgi:hypothetical protein
VCGARLWLFQPGAVLHSIYGAGDNSVWSPRIHSRSPPLRQSFSFCYLQSVRRLRIVALLNGGVKRVHVYVDDFPHYELEKYIGALSIQEPRVCLF